MNLPLDAKSYQLLQKLIETPGYSRVQQLAENLSVSRRSVYYSLNKINEFLESHGLENVEIERKLGIIIKDTAKDEIKKILENVESSEIYVFSPMERVRYISCLIIYERKVFIDFLCEQLRVSRNTVFNDLKAVEVKLARYELVLKFNPKDGYSIEGDRIKVRALFLYNFQMLLPLYNSRIIRFSNEIQINLNYYLLKRIEDTLNVQYVKGSLFSLSILIQTYVENQEEGSFDDLDAEEIKRSREYRLVEKYFPQFIEEEKLYLSVHLLGGRLQAFPIFNKSEGYSAQAYQLASDLIFEFERSARIEISDREGLLEAISVHLKTSMFRYKFGITVESPLMEDIIKNYNELFMLTKKACSYLQRRIGLPINDSEIAFLTLHFGSFIKGSKKKEVRLLLVCPNGVATGKMLKQEIQKLIPEGKIVDIVSSRDVSHVKDRCDLLISTVQVSSDVPTLMVNPILTNTDRTAILNYLSPMMVQEMQHKFSAPAIYETFCSFVESDKQEDFKQAVYHYFENQDFFTEIKKTGILKYLELEKINFISAANWRESIIKTSQPLLKIKSLSQQYVQQMINEIENYGPYNFITEGVVLAHAKPIEGETKIDFGISIIKEGVDFGQGKIAYVVMVLSVDSTEDHLNILRDILAVFGVQENVEILKQLDTKESVLSFFQEKLSD